MFVKSACVGGHIAVPALVDGFDNNVLLSPWLGLAAKSLSHSKSSENPSASSAVGGAAGSGCDIIGWTASSARSRPRGPSSRGNRLRLLRGSGCIPTITATDAAKHRKCKQHALAQSYYLPPPLHLISLPFLLNRQHPIIVTVWRIQRNRTCWPVVHSRDVKASCSSAAISLWNNFEIISGKFPRAEIKLFQMYVDKG